MLFSRLYIPHRVADAVGDAAWIRAMLTAEAALSRAEARAGVIPAAAAGQIAAACEGNRFDSESIATEARQVGNPAEPLVRALRRAVPEDAARFVHLGATSQDIVDTAAMLVVRDALVIIEDDLAGVAFRFAQLADEHRHTLMAGRTLLQQALPITVGLKAAGWLMGVVRARSTLRRLRGDVLAVQLGGAAGTLASLGDAGVTVLREMAGELQLPEPVLPWHTERTRLAEIGAGLGQTSGAADKAALDIVLLAQTEVGEVVESGDGRRGGSSTLPHKRNPVAAVLVRACAREAQAQAEVLMRGIAQEHERAAGGWQAEWPALSGALASTGGAVSWLREALDGFEVRPERMRENLDATRGLIMAEQVASLLAVHLGREEAHDLLRSLTRLATERGTGLKEVLLEDETVRRYMSADDIDQAMDPGWYLGSAGAFIDRALAFYRSEPS